LSQILSERIPIRDLARTPYIRILTYPTISLRTAKSRIKQLEKLGVKFLIFEGKSKIGSLGLLGLGTVSVVVKAQVNGGTLALKIRRTDANRAAMTEEFRLTNMANRIGIGAEALGHTRDLMLLRYLDYIELHEWFKSLSGQGRRDRAREMVHGVLNQCRKLDIIGLDHGELSNLRKHVVVVDGSPYMLDFESAGLNRSTKNVTTAAQYILVGGKMSPLVRRLIGVAGVRRIIESLRQYKRDKSDINYSRLLKTLRIIDD
jgi:putative serine/threonine protein kinase